MLDRNKLVQAMETAYVQKEAGLINNSKQLQNEKYQILFKNKPVFSIVYGSGEVEIYNTEFMPADIYLEESDDFDDRLNNIVNFNCWCSERILNLDRKYAHEILNHFGFSQNLSDKEKAKIAIQTRCLSLNDCYWLRKDTESVSFEEVNLFDNSLKDAVFEIALFGSSPTVTNQLPIPDLVTDGTAPKAWVRREDGFYLYKGDVNDSVVRETEASQMLRLLGLEVVEYKKESFNGQPVSASKCFTNKDINFVRAQYFNEKYDIQEYIFKFKEQFDRMNLADYIVGNTDEHPRNWGFLYDETMKIVSMNPPMDYDHALLGSGNSICLPYRLLGNPNVLQVDEAVSIIKNRPNIINFDVNLSEFKYGEFVKERLNYLKQFI